MMQRTFNWTENRKHINIIRNIMSYAMNEIFNKKKCILNLNDH